MKFILASKNQKKLKELSRILAPLGIEALCENDIDTALPEVEETGSTFMENARLKAVSAMKATGMPAVADDSGLCVDALNGEPGIYSARYSGENADDKSNNAKLLNALSDVPEDKRGAHFMCAICVVFPNGDEVIAEGRAYGSIALSPSGAGGFGYDPLFIVGDKSFGELSAEEKDKISHRGAALRELKQRLEVYLNDNK